MRFHEYPTLKMIVSMDLCTVKVLCVYVLIGVMGEEWDAWRSCQEIGAVLIDLPDQHDGEGDGFVRRWDFLVKDSTWKTTLGVDDC